MIKIGQVVKLKNPKKKGENKRRWRVIGTPEVYLQSQSPISVAEGNMLVATTVASGTNAEYTVAEIFNPVVLRRLDTATHRLERENESNLAPISFWERLFKRY